MKDTRLKQMKSHALYSVYKQYADGRFRTQLEASRFIVTQPAPRFYISPRQATFLIKRIQARISLIDLNSLQRKQAWCLYDRYQDYLSDDPCAETETIEEAMELLTEKPAPEFFITPEGARKMLRNEIREERRRRGW